MQYKGEIKGKSFVIKYYILKKKCYPGLWNELSKCLHLQLY